MEEENVKKETNKMRIIAVATMVGVVLLTFLVLFATGAISFKTDTNSNSKSSEIQDTNAPSTDSEVANDYANEDGYTFTSASGMKWEIAEEAKKYVTLEEISLTDEISTKKVKLIGLDDNLTSQFYKDQQAVIDDVQVFNDEFIKGGPVYNVKAFVNNGILSVIYLLEERNAVGICGDKMAVANIDLDNKKIINQEELLAMANTSYKKLSEEYYNSERSLWEKANEQDNYELEYYGLKLDEFKADSVKFINMGEEKLPNIIYVYIENGKIKYDYYSIRIGTLFHQVGKGGCFSWESKTLGDYKKMS